MKNKSLKILGIIVLFIILLIGFVVGISESKSMDLIDVAQSFEDMNSSNIKFKLKQKREGENVNFIYNFNYDKNFSDDTFSNVMATDGTFGLEVDSLEMGLYAPLKLIVSDDIHMYLEIDESYEDVFGIPGGDTIHASLTSLRKNLGVNLELKKIKEIINLTKDDFTKALKEINKKSAFYKSDKQKITTGVIGRIGLILSKEDIDLFYNVFKNNLDETTLKDYGIDAFFKYLSENFVNSTLYIDVYGGYVNKITLSGAEDFIEIEISNINNKNTISIPKDGYIELVNYLERGAVDILKLLGFEVETTLTRLAFLQDSFSDFATYIIASIDYSDKANYEYADICLENMEAIINNMKGKIFSEEDDSLDKNIYNKYIEFFGLMKDYCSTYKNALQNDINDNDKLQESIDKLTEISKELGIDVSGLVK